MRSNGIYFFTTDWRGENLSDKKKRAFELKSYGGVGEPDLFVPYQSNIKNSPLDVFGLDLHSSLVIELKTSLTEVFYKNGKIKYSMPNQPGFNKKTKLKYWHNLIQFAYMGWLINQGFYATYAVAAPPYGLIDFWCGLNNGNELKTNNLYTPLLFFGNIGCSWAFVEAVKEVGPAAYLGEYEKLPRIDWEYYE